MPTRPWCGQTMFTFPVISENPNNDADVNQGESVADEASDLGRFTREHESVAEFFRNSPHEADMMFRIKETHSKESPVKEHVCPVCGACLPLVRCGCCSAAVEVCRACCLLRHTEQRYRVHDPDESSGT